MKVQIMSTKKYAELAGLSHKGGIISQRLRKFAKTGELKEMPGVINVRRFGREWSLYVLVSWIEGKEAENEA